ncbi:MAG: FUSC family protein [Acidobacteriaceae bacterium]
MTDPAAIAPADADRLNLQQGMRTAVATALAYWLTGLLHLPGGYWAAISAIVVMQSEVGATLAASRDRIAGTIMGAGVGWLTALVWHSYLLVFALAVLVVMVLCSLLKYKKAGRLGGVTIAIIVLIPQTGPVWHIALERFLEVSFGIVVSLLVAVGWTKVGNLFRHHTA